MQGCFHDDDVNVDVNDMKQQIIEERDNWEGNGLDVYYKWMTITM